MSLATKYRPETLDQIEGQTTTIKILENAVKNRNFKHAYLFAGSSGTGKTSAARCFAKAINQGQGEPIEIDCASVNSVDNIRTVCAQASQRALDSEYKIYVLDECVTGDTEILTDKGFKRFDQLNKTELIAQYNNGKIEFVKPLEYVEKNYSGDMYKLTIGNKGSFYMTPNHVQPLFYEKSKLVKEKYVKDLKPCQANRFIMSGDGVGSLTKLTAIDRLAIALQADGTLQQSWKSHNYWTIQLRKERKINRLIDLLEDSGLQYKEIKCNRIGDRRFSILTPTSITKLFKTHFDLTLINKSFAEEFIAELMLWDEHRKDNSKYYYYSSVCKENVDFAQSIGILGGFKSRIGTQEDHRKETYKVSYRLYLQKSYISTPNTSVKKTKVQYNGKIYCIKVPSHNIIIRRDNIEIITGNCHALSGDSWKAFLKTIEETPEYTIFIFCTTDPEKIPTMVLNRLQRYNFSAIDSETIKNRLIYVCQQEGFTNYEKTCDLISKTVHGCMRDALTKLEQCADFSKDLSLENAKQVLTGISYETMFKLTWALQDKDEGNILSIIDNLYNEGTDLKNFISLYLEFILDLSKYEIFKNINLTNIPTYLATEENPVVQQTVNFEDSISWFNNLIDSLLSIKVEIKYDSSYLSTIKAFLLRFCR